MTRRRFSEQQKAQYVAYALAQRPRSLREVALELGVGCSTLERWLRQERTRSGATVNP